MSGSGAPSGTSLPLRSLLPAGPRHAQGKPRGAEDRGTPVFLLCSSGLQARCGRTSQCSTRQTGIQQQTSAAQRVPGPARHLGALAVRVPTGCLQPVGLAPALAARGSACCSAASKKRTSKNCQNRTFKNCANMTYCIQVAKRDCQCLIAPVSLAWPRPRPAVRDPLPEQGSRGGLKRIRKRKQ